MPDRPRLDDAHLSDAASTKIANFHADVVREVQQAVRDNDVVVVGMGWNPHVQKARNALTEAGIAHTYLGYGNYISQWKQRLAIKLWSGWPTFPQVFVKGMLIGGNSDLRKALADGTVKELLSEQ
jgi:monothiol glutaredoxin